MDDFMGTAGCVYARKSKTRTALRKVAGRLWYCAARRLQWALSGKRYARVRPAGRMAHIAASHSTPLFRSLANVDMWMQRNKVTNLRLAAARIDGIVVKPGETFSFWKAVGKPTAAKGYLPGMVLSGGRVKPGVGGGLCQMTNLVYWMALHTPLTVTERHRHSYDVFPDSNRTQPFGSGATCSWNYLDLQIRNDTDEAYQLSVKLTDDSLVGSWLSEAPSGLRYEVYESEHRISSNPWGGYIRHNALRRRVFDGEGRQVGDEPVAENDAMMMYQPFLAEAASLQNISTQV